MFIQETSFVLYQACQAKTPTSVVNLSVLSQCIGNGSVAGLVYRFITANYNIALQLNCSTIVLAGHSYLSWHYYKETNLNIN